MRLGGGEWSLPLAEAKDQKLAQSQGDQKATRAKSLKELVGPPGFEPGTNGDLRVFQTQEPLSN
jgi:hypothetical protein